MIIGSKEWLVARQAKAASLQVPTHLEMTIEQVVTGAEGCVWHVVISDGRISYHGGPAAKPTVTISGTQKVIEDISHNRRSAQRAFLDGQLSVSGDIASLLHAPLHPLI